MRRRVYLASSWRNPIQPALVEPIRRQGHEVYDFRNPPNSAGFGWEEVMPGFHIDTQEVDAEDYIRALDHPRALEGFAADYEAMQWADTFVLALPCGRSAHLELGWAVGAGKQTAIYLNPDWDNRVQPELMYKMVDFIAPRVGDLFEWLGEA